MKCSKCKHDFCWVCLESWKKHSTATGGYFRCNRYEVVKKVEEQKEMLKTEVELKNKHVQELNRFVHYYSRFKNHENSYKLELPLFQTAKDKMITLARAVLTNDELVEQQTEFIHEAVRQLLRARHVLKCSYVYGYYLEQTGYKKPIFEFMQTELEECTETLSQMVSRPYLRTPRAKIIQAAYNLLRKRHEFLSAISKGLVPPDTSPSLKKKSKIFTVEVDEATRKVLLTSLHKDPRTSWVKAPNGKHTNVSALLDWPEDSDESDSETVAAITAADVSSSPATTTTASGRCKRSGCRKQCVVSPRTGQLQEYCSLKCKNLDDFHSDVDSSVAHSSTQSTCQMPDYELDLLRAMEMSRLHFLQETNRQLALGQPTDIAVPQSDATSDMIQQDVATSQIVMSPTNIVDADLEKAFRLSRITYQKEEQDLKLALRLSLEEMPKSSSTSTNQSQIDQPQTDQSAAAILDTNILSESTDSGNMFGPIKNLRVNNILVLDANKTFDFDTKNFKKMFCPPSPST
jgi:ankyrin repeat/IBR domain-containing protein 1